MSIITSFDNKTKAMISPEDIVPACDVRLNTCITMWQHKISKELLEQDLVEEIARISSGKTAPNRFIVSRELILQSRNLR